MENEAPHILVVDDEHGILDSLRRIYEREDYRVSVTDNGLEALDIIRKDTVHIVLADIMMPKMNGIELLKAVKAISPSIEVIMMTAFGTVENAVETMRHGAYDFISKPLRRAIVVRSVQRALERRALVIENQVLKKAVDQHQGQDSIIGAAPVWRSVVETVQQAAPSDATVLLTGESGTGKEVLAQELHRYSHRSNKEFVAVNCAALPEGLLESELFGHEKGSFTGALSQRSGRFERANGGTLFLDEIGETSPAVQVRLLRALQEGEIERVGGQKLIPVDVRIVAATQRNLEEDVAAGLFREDLYYRLNVIQVKLPALRNRPGDALLLANYILKRYVEKNKKSIVGFSEAALRVIDSYGWPGNVRELENLIERAVVLCQGTHIGLDDLPPNVANTDSSTSSLRTEEDGIFIPFGTKLEEVERRLIEATLERTGGDKKTAATLLGITSRTIYRKLE
ncbi:sigma-54-dependent Fis family transcriptional regulator [Myxococcota bacterium]|nr:sigma-54-dependent Fis family transcriptional regulator [Myxococcota bacterium]